VRVPGSVPDRGHRPSTSPVSRPQVRNSARLHTVQQEQAVAEQPPAGERKPIEEIALLRGLLGRRPRTSKLQQARRETATRRGRAKARSACIRVLVGQWLSLGPIEQNSKDIAAGNREGEPSRQRKRLRPQQPGCPPAQVVLHALQPRALLPRHAGRHALVAGTSGHCRPRSHRRKGIDALSQAPTSHPHRRSGAASWGDTPNWFEGVKVETALQRGAPAARTLDN